MPQGTEPSRDEAGTLTCYRCGVEIPMAKRQTLSPYRKPLCRPCLAWVRSRPLDPTEGPHRGRG